MHCWLHGAEQAVYLLWQALQNIVLQSITKQCWAEHKAKLLSDFLSYIVFKELVQIPEKFKAMVKGEVAGMEKAGAGQMSVWSFF